MCACIMRLALSLFKFQRFFLAQFEPFSHVHEWKFHFHIELKHLSGNSRILSFKQISKIRIRKHSKHQVVIVYNWKCIPFIWKYKALFDFFCVWIRIPQNLAFVARQNIFVNFRQLLVLFLANAFSQWKTGRNILAYQCLSLVFFLRRILSTLLLMWSLVIKLNKVVFNNNENLLWTKL